MKKVYEALKWASSFLEQHSRDTNIGEIYLCHMMQWSRSTMLANLQEVLPTEQVAELEEVVKKHAIDGVPVQQMIGSETFYGRNFIVTENVLIPRPETEELIELILNYAKENIQTVQNVKVADIGVGSGAICVTLQSEKPEWDVVGVDISSAALQVAKKNNEELGAKVQFLQGDLLAPLIEAKMKVNILVSNPPYISEEDYQQLSDVVQKHEPKLALVGGEDGLDCYRTILNDLPKVLEKDAAVFFEYGMGQGELIKELTLSLYKDANVEIFYDINGKDRMIQITGITPEVQV